MTHYFIDNRTQPDGAHEVHSRGCSRMAADKHYLGDFSDFLEAMMEARKTFWDTSGCLRCSPEKRKFPAAVGGGLRMPTA
jgi:hypothetical protein